MNSRRQSRVYPHSRGGTGAEHFSVLLGEGLSPLAWGNPDNYCNGADTMGSIPTRVGEPCDYVHFRISLGVYPHSRGGTAASVFGVDLDTGLSPLAWGNLLVGIESPVAIGSIPTRVGEPRSRSRSTSPTGVYPHSRGGTHNDYVLPDRPRGLSPLAWGNPL